MSEKLGDTENVHNPYLERAMTPDMVRRGVGFAVVDLTQKEEKQIVLRGTFAQDAARSQTSGWEFVWAAIIDPEDASLVPFHFDLAELGVVQRSDGSWRPQTYAVVVEELCREL